MNRSPCTWFGVGLAAGLLGGVLLARRRDEGQHTPHLDVCMYPLHGIFGSSTTGWEPRRPSRASTMKRRSDGPQ